MDPFTMLWIFWIAMFFAIEVPAILNKRRGDTLSEHVWRWFAVTDKPAGWQLRRFILLTFLAWLTVHFLTGGWV
jgi:hypothetical protein